MVSPFATPTSTPPSMPIGPADSGLTITAPVILTAAAVAAVAACALSGPAYREGPTRRDPHPLQPMLNRAATDLTLAAWDGGLSLLGRGINAVGTWWTARQASHEVQRLAASVVQPEEEVRRLMQSIAEAEAAFNAIMDNTALSPEERLEQARERIDAIRTSLATIRPLIAQIRTAHVAIQALLLNAPSERPAAARVQRALEVVSAGEAHAAPILDRLSNEFNIASHLERLRTILQKAQSIKVVAETRDAAVVEASIDLKRSAAEELDVARQHQTSLNTAWITITPEDRSFLERALVEIRGFAEHLPNAAANVATAETLLQTIRATFDATNVLRSQLELRVNNMTLLVQHLQFLETLERDASLAMRNAEDKADAVQKIFDDKGRPRTEAAAATSLLATEASSFAATAAACFRSARARTESFTKLLSENKDDFTDASSLTDKFRAIEDLSLRARASADRALSLATRISRTADEEASKAAARINAQREISTFITNLRDVSPTSYIDFKKRLQTLYPSIQEEIPHMLLQALQEKLSAVNGEIAFYRSGAANESAKASNQAAIRACLDEVRVLRGTGFDGPIDARWRAFFEAKRQEVLAGCKLCRSKHHEISPDTPRDLTESEISEIIAVLPNEDGSLERLIAIGERYKASIGRSGNSFSDIATTADSGLRQSYDTKNAAQEAAKISYDFENGKYNRICGEGFNPDKDISADGTCRVAAGTTIATYQANIAELERDVEERIAFWEAVKAAAEGRGDLP